MAGLSGEKRRSRVCTGFLLLWALFLAVLTPAPASSHDPQDQVLEQIGVEERLGGHIPGDLAFRDQNGKTVLLADFFTGRPVVLTLNYYACPTLCPLVFRNLAETAGRMGALKLSRDFRIVTVSINPDESPELAREKSALTYRMLGRTADPETRWPFLMGNRASIERLAQSVGVRYTRLGKHEFAHPNVLVVATPDGRVSRYLYGLEQKPQDLKLALIEAADGKIGASAFMNRALLYCFHYDPVGKKYVLFAARLMTAAMLGVLLLTLGLLIWLWKKERKAPPVS
jgi:protein SCO1